MHTPPSTLNRREPRHSSCSGRRQMQGLAWHVAACPPRTTAKNSPLNHSQEELRQMGLHPNNVLACGVDFLFRLKPEALAPHAEASRAPLNCSQCKAFPEQQQAT